MKEHILPGFEKEISRSVEKKLKEKGVNLYTSTKLEKILSKEDRLQSVKTSQGEIESDIVILAPGVKPESDIAKEAGLETGVRDAIVVDEFMRTSNKDILAAGDCVQSYHIVSGSPVYIPLALTANKQGMFAGRTLAGISKEFKGVAGTAVTKVFDLEVARTGLGLEQAQKEGFNAVKVKIKSKDKAGYYPGAASLMIALIVDKDTARVLGAEMSGTGVYKRIDTIVSSLYSEASVYDILDYDLAYAPPFSPVWDPVLQAARVALKKI